MTDIFALETETLIDRKSSYILSYPYLLSYFSSKQLIAAEDVVCGAHMVYGWMPTVLDLYPHSPNISLAEGADILNKAKNSGVLSDCEIEQLACLVNNSLVGASKLLHFVAPDFFPIWDSKIYTYLFRNKPYGYRIGDVSNYRLYLSRLDELRRDSRFGLFHDSVSNKVGYPISEIRALEVIMFHNSPVLDE